MTVKQLYLNIYINIFHFRPKIVCFDFMPGKHCENDKAIKGHQVQQSKRFTNCVSFFLSGPIAR